MQKIKLQQAREGSEGPQNLRGPAQGIEAYEFHVFTKHRHGQRLRWVSEAAAADEINPAVYAVMEH
jgi:hypothetical protein